MSRNYALFSTYPKGSYVFVVISLASFLAMFALGRRPGIRYQVAVPLSAQGLRDPKADALTEQQRNELTAQASDQCRDAELIYSALKSAGLGDDIPPQIVNASVQSISRRLSVRFREISSANQGIEIRLDTDKPAAGIDLLDSLAAQIGDRSDQQLRPLPAKVVSRRGGSVSASRLLVLGLLSVIVGCGAVWVSRRLQPTTVLVNEGDVRELVKIPVLHLEGQSNDDKAARTTTHRRWIKACIVAAEIGIAAVFVLMLYNVLATEAFSTRLLSNPLTAYGEALAQLVS